MNETGKPFWELIDAVLVLNMPECEARWQSFKERAAERVPMDKVHKIAAVKGVDVPGYGEFPYFRGDLGERAPRWGGAAGCTLSHRKAVEYARERDWERVLILEDDVEVSEELEAVAPMLAQAVAQAREPYLFYLGFHKPNPYGVQKVQWGASAGGGVWKVEGVLAAHAYIVPRSMYDPLLRYLPDASRIWAWMGEYKAVDEFYHLYAASCIGCSVYAVYPCLIRQVGKSSTIGQGAVNYVEYECSRPPVSYFSVPGALHALLLPLIRLKHRLDRFRKRCRTRKKGLPR